MLESKHYYDMGFNPIRGGGGGGAVFENRPKI